MSILTQTSNTDVVGDILFKIQEDISQLRSQLLTKGAKADRSTVKNLIARTENGVKQASETYARALNSQVTVLSQHSSRSTRRARSEERGYYPVHNRSRDNHSPPFFGISPGLRAKIEHESRILSNPENPINRMMLSDKFNIQLPMIEPRPKTENIPSLQRGPNVESFGSMPKPNRINPFLPPPAIKEKDGKAGIISLVQRGLIPVASELRLQPSPVGHHKMNIHPHDDAHKKLIPLCDLGEQNFNQLVDGLARKQARQPDAKQSMGSNSSVHRSEKSENPLRPQVTPVTDKSERSEPRVCIKDGMLREGEEFDYLKQKYCIVWGDMQLVLRRMELFCQQYNISVGFVDGNRVKEMCEENEAHLLTKNQIIDCFSNRGQIGKFANEKGRQFKGVNGEKAAAIMIQKTYRRYVCRKKYIKYRELKWSAGMIAISWIMKVKLSKMRRLLHQIRADQLQAFKQRQVKFSAEWQRISNCRRIEIHLPSLGFAQRIRDTMSDLPVIENLQISRLCSIVDPNVDVIYISPIPVRDDLLLYYNRLLGLDGAILTGNRDTETDVQKRFRLIVPDHLDRFPTHHMALSTLLKYSPRTVRQIKNLIFGREAYIVPSILSKDDLAIADVLGVPMLAPEPEIQRLYSTKSGTRRIFASAQVLIPPGECDIYSMNQLYDALAQLITENIFVTKWLLKIDDSYDGRGIAVFESNKLPCYNTVVKEARRYGDKWVKKWAQEPSFVRVLSELPEALTTFARPTQKKAYLTIERFLDDLKANGGVIEAYPPGDDVTNLTVDMLIAPDGDISFLTSGDQIHGDNELQHWGYSCPQSSIEADVLNPICLRVAEGCKKRSIIGYLSIDFVTFVEEDGTQHLWATDLSLRYSDLLAMTKMWHFGTKGTFDEKNHSYVVSRPKTESNKRSLGKQQRDDFTPYRYAVLSNRLSHTNLQMVHYSVFFQMCRAHGIGFDIVEKQGTLFAIVNSENRRRLAMVTVFDDLQGALVGFARNLHVIHQEVSAPHMQGISNFKGAIADIESILGTTMDNEKL